MSSQTVKLIIVVCLLTPGQQQSFKGLNLLFRVTVFRFHRLSLSSQEAHNILDSLNGDTKMTKSKSNQLTWHPYPLIYNMWPVSLTSFLCIGK